MSQTVGMTRLAYSRTWHHISASTPHSVLSTFKPTPKRMTESSDPNKPPPHMTPPPMGRLASRIAYILMGKHKPIWDPSTDCGDYVVVTNCSALYLTGKKKWQKTYYRSNTRPGSLRSITMDALIEKFGGGEALRRAVSGMLPKNRLRTKRLERLKVFEGDKHPYEENLSRYNGVKVGQTGWEEAVKKIREPDNYRL
ncbi:putative mitochondrial LSU ribosomal protein L23 precursor [Zalerion maritima]|uniref:Large ribosomal subunit protein uL13m n=1 Tax=Zalerion maritima TaxID=339359 RepID=A0AAD5RT13_9PEZI|nr:putative mitochondrial LSU ribosomal protein L23 precursor [Zalerion maritima]